MKATDHGTIELTVLEMLILNTLGFIAVISNGEVIEITKVRKETR